MDAESSCENSTGLNLNGSGRPRSSVWGYFEYVQSSHKSVCKIDSCGVEVRRKFTTNLKSHVDERMLNITVKMKKLRGERIQYNTRCPTI